MTICPENKCTGCGACKAVCKFNAISFSASGNHSPVAVVDETLCKNCNLCKKICPAVNQPEFNNSKTCYALWAKDKDDQINSASAGAVSSFYRKVLSDGGVVFGTRFIDNKLVFDFAETEKDAFKFRGSRYIQADVGDAYIKVKSFLENNRKVLFVGTPCQIGGLKNFLGKPYEHLITIDLICHGVAPSEFFNTYAKEVIGNKPYSNVEFRGKNGIKLAIYNTDGKAVYLKPKMLDLYYSAYAKGLIHRENCYSCQYAGTQRCSDITAGDFWGLDLTTLKNKTLKTPVSSVCLINTDKGETFFKDASDYIEYEERTIAELLPHNKQLTAPCQPHSQRKMFLESFKTKGFSESVKATEIGKAVKKEKTKNLLSVPYRIVRKAVKKIIHR
ncbi:MAG: Coenzyme F420 hydrogenase/dehydrogenase, beta subunit C-terminal domain [Clostridia bacterium]|nr:Coenzyme F420 hydrogenase/dehydrogenase, beta subunit C-terminal domain [Clostridia bacterium]